MKIVSLILFCIVCLLVTCWAHEKEKEDFAKKVADELENRQQEKDNDI